MRYLLPIFALALTLCLSSQVLAQDANIQWKDLSAGERQGILNTWRALPQGEKGPFIQYREQAIKDLSDDKKAQYKEVAKERASKEEKLQEAYEKRQVAEEKQNKLKVEKDNIAPIEPVAPIDNNALETATPAEPATPAVPAVENSEKAKKNSAPQGEKAKTMWNKIF